MKRTLNILILIGVFSCIWSLDARAQRWSLATNLLDYLNFGTLNAEVGVSVHKHWTLSLSGRYNPFYFDFPSRPMVNKKASGAIGARYWPFFVYSGFYYGFGAQYMMFRSGGILSETTREGTAVGGTFDIGYSLMISKHLNIEFGIGIWAGASEYKKYDAPRCGKKLKEVTEPFIVPNKLQINLLFNF